ncbi:Zn(2)-C6 fungal-type domain-containing protein [Mycena kentingensis (nom. inval.)]|nr:Zn(2)-C6 fungal-type domain-containing protein [Mycena kentingensis (nom. inval.)]
MSTTPAPQPKKLKACDSCKAKRVLCHPQPNGMPCPRCAEKHILCKTTYIPRGRPRTNDPSATLITSAPTNRGTVANDPLANPELVRYLYSCLAKLPQHHHPLLRALNLDITLTAAAWRVDLLHPQAAVLAHCICALAARVAFHPAIIGRELYASADRDFAAYKLGDKFAPGADLRVYGVAREGACKMLLERAVKMAGEAQVQVEVSEYNTASCYLLDALEEDILSSSRPWAASYMSHVRTLMPEWPDNPDYRALWAGQMFAEGLRGVVNRKPVLVTMADQLFISQGQPRSLESMLEQARKHAVVGELSQSQLEQRAVFLFEIVLPLLFHATSLCRTFYETISGEFARRQPISEPALRKVVDELTIIRGLVTHAFANIDFHDPGFWTIVAGYPELELNLRYAIYGLSVLFAALAMTLYRELERRGAGTGTEQGRDKWESAAITFLRTQAHELALSALPEIRLALTMQKAPLFTVALKWTNLMDWSEFLADQADQQRQMGKGLADVGAVGSVAVDETVKTYQQVLWALKEIGYSYTGERLNVLIARIEAHLAAHHNPNSGQLAVHMGAPTPMAPPTPPDFELHDHSATLPLNQILSEPLPEMSFLLDGTWLQGSSLDI